MSNLNKAEQDFQIIKNNIISSYYDADGDYKKILKNMLPDGSFSDLDYQNQKWSDWPPAIHLKRAADLCRIYSCPENKAYHSPELKEKIINLIEYFIEGKFRSDNWWQNDVGVPMWTGIIRLLFQNEMPDEMNDELLRLFKGNPDKPSVFSLYSNDSVDGLRPYRSQSGHMFAQLVDTHVYVATINGDPYESMRIIKNCIRAISHELSVIPWAAGCSPNGLYSEEHSFKTDYSYHEHENSFLQNTYGNLMLGALASLIDFWEGTSLSIPEDAAEELTNIFLDGYAYTRYRGYTPMMTLGRNVASANSKEYYNQNVQDHFVTICDHILKKDISRSDELKAFRNQMANPKTVPHFTGNKFFWHSDFLSHNRENFQFTVHGVSDRIKRPESILKKNVKGMFLGDGCYNLLLTGNEYEGLAPCIDWRRLQGTTVNVLVSDEQLNPECEIDTKIDTLRIFGGAKGTKPFAGGASDGENGFFAMEYDHFGVSAKKAWFCMDDVIVCLGADITADESAHAFTTLNQCRLSGDVYADGEKISNGQRNMSSVQWVHHNNVSYVFLQNSDNIHIKNECCDGSWFLVDKDNGSEDNVTQPIFLLGIDHGKAKEASYAYCILTNADMLKTKSFCKNTDIDIVANEKKCQAVYYHKKQQLQAVFYEAGLLDIGDFTLTVDVPCAILLIKRENGFMLYASNPLHTEETLHIKLDGSIEDDIEIVFKSGFRSNNLGRQVIYDSQNGVLPFTGAKGDI